MSIPLRDPHVAPPPPPTIAFASVQLLPLVRISLSLPPPSRYRPLLLLVVCTVLLYGAAFSRPVFFSVEWSPLELSP